MRWKPGDLRMGHSHTAMKLPALTEMTPFSSILPGVSWRSANCTATWWYMGSSRSSRAFSWLSRSLRSLLESSDLPVGKRTNQSLQDRPCPKRALNFNSDSTPQIKLLMQSQKYMHLRRHSTCNFKMPPFIGPTVLACRILSVTISNTYYKR